MSGAGWTRLLVASALVFLTVVTAAVPHRHSFAQGLLTIAAADAPARFTTDDLDAATRGHEYPCDACARQRGFGLAPSIRLAAAPRAEAVLPAPAPSIAERSGQGPNVWLRGPPSATSVC
jgi:hypothetical protein